MGTLKQFAEHEQNMYVHCTIEVEPALLYWNVLGRCWDMKVDNSDISVSCKRGKLENTFCEQITR